MFYAILQLKLRSHARNTTVVSLEDRCRFVIQLWGSLKQRVLVYEVCSCFFFIGICNTTYKNIQYTTLLTLLALLTTQYYITFSFPFTHTEREKNEKEKKGKRRERNYLLHLYFRYFKILHITIK